MKGRLAFRLCKFPCFDSTCCRLKRPGLSAETLSCFSPTLASHFDVLWSARWFYGSPLEGPVQESRKVSPGKDYQPRQSHNSGRSGLHDFPCKWECQDRCRHTRHSVQVWPREPPCSCRRSHCDALLYLPLQVTEIKQKPSKLA